MTTWGFGFGSGSSAAVEPINERIHEFITSEIMHGILDMTLVMFGTIKEWIMELLAERLGALHAEMAACQFGSRTLSFQDFKACGPPEFFGKKYPIDSKWWIAYVENTQRMSFYLDGTRVRFSSFLMRDRVWDWWEEVGHSHRAGVIEAMTLTNFFTRFRADFHLLSGCKSCRESFRTFSRQQRP